MRLISKPRARGWRRLGIFDERTGLTTWRRPRRANQIQYYWGFVAAKCIGMGLRGYRVSAFYLEYANVAEPGDPVTVPSFPRSAGRSYYDDLQSSGNLDYLRIPIATDPTLGIADGYGDFFIPGVTGNALTYMVQSAGTVGINGKPFSSDANSTIYGAAAVATPVFSDISQDIVFARGYFAAEEQVVKEPSKQVVLSWEFDFE